MLAKISNIVVLLTLNGLLAVSGLAYVYRTAPQNDEVGIAIGTGLLVTGLSGAVLVLVRILDDLLSHSGARSTSDKLTELSSAITELSTKVTRISHNSIVRNDSETRCIFDRHVREAVRNSIENSPQGSLFVDAIGFSLWRFYQEQLSTIEAKRRFTVRLLVQHPMEMTFDQLAQQEGRNLQEMKAETIQLTRHLLDLIGTNSKGKAIEIRWFPYTASITMVRVNEEYFVRPRVFKEGRDTPVFYERYGSADPKCTGALADHFNMMWNASITPTNDDLLKFRKSIDAGSA